MEKRLVAMAAAAGGLVIGVAGAGLFMHAQAAIPISACSTYDAATDAKADAAMKQLHAHDHDQYVPHAAPSPLGDVLKPANAQPAQGPSQ
jgi:hypothetical protein